MKSLPHIFPHIKKRELFRGSIWYRIYVWTLSYVFESLQTCLCGGFVRSCTSFFLLTSCLPRIQIVSKEVDVTRRWSSFRVRCTVCNAVEDGLSQWSGATKTFVFPFFFLLTIFITKHTKHKGKIRETHDSDHKNVYFHLNNNVT